MSSQFVQESNQNMLWKIVSSTSQLTDFFKMLPPGSKEEWFKGMMKDYNINILPRMQKNAGNETRSFTTYNGINQGM